MDKEELAPEIDDCETGDQGLAAKEVLKGAFDDLTEEIKQFVTNQSLRNDARQAESRNTQNQRATSTTISTSATGEHRRREQADVKTSQKKVAGDLLEIIKRSQQHIKPENFDYFDMFIIIPKFICLG